MREGEGEGRSKGGRGGVRRGEETHRLHRPTTLLVSKRVSLANPPWVEPSSTGPAPRHTLCSGKAGSTGSSGTVTMVAAGHEW